MYERFESYNIQKLSSFALSMPNGVKEDVLLSRLKAGIPSRLRDQSHLATGSFNEVLTRLSRVLAA